MKSRRSDRDRGAIAVEFAILVPFLLIIIIGIVEFSRVYNAQISVTQAAREGARAMAVLNDVGQAQTQAVTAAPGLNPALAAGNVAITPSACSADTNASATVTYTFPSLTNFFGTSATVTGVGVMRCGG